MKTYNLIEKNGNAAITLSADSEEEVEEWEKENLKYLPAWRLECVDEDEDEE